MLSEHDLAKGSIAQLLHEVILVQLVLVPLHVQQCFEAVRLELFGFKVKKARSVRRDISLYRVEHFQRPFAIIDFLGLGYS